MENAFDEAHKNLYIGAQRAANPPHVYAVVQDCYFGLFNKTIAGPPSSHAMVITGESGAGKTFTTGKVLGFIDSINSSVTSKRMEYSEAHGSITERIMATMPIMDAFGNACMPRNDDSSRFGKLYKIYFSKQKQTVSALNPHTTQA